MRILIIEDEPQLARHIHSALTRQGHTVSSALDGAQGLQLARQAPPDLVVLDINLPSMDGLTILQNLRHDKNPTRVLLLTSLNEISDRVRGLKAGADDYLAKPFAMDELIARVDALGRRGAIAVASATLQVADLHLNVETRRVSRGGEAIALSPREFELLHVLMQEPGRYFARTELHDRIWQSEHRYDSRTVEMFIARLRKKIDAEHTNPLIHTQRNMGYTIKAPAP